MYINGMFLGIVLGAVTSSAVWYWSIPKQVSVLEAEIPPEGRTLLSREAETVQLKEIQRSKFRCIEHRRSGCKAIRYGSAPVLSFCMCSVRCSMT